MFKWFEMCMSCAGCEGASLSKPSVCVILRLILPQRSLKDWRFWRWSAGSVGSAQGLF